MAQFTFTNNTYAGSALAGYMASTLLEADSVKRGLLTVVNDVKARKVILDVDDDVVLQDPSGMFHDQGTTAKQNERYLDPVVFEFMKQEQWDKLIQSWEVQSVNPGSMMDYEGVVDLSDFMVQRYLTKIQIANERLYWLGKSATNEATFTAPFAGLLPTIAAASGTTNVRLSNNVANYVAITAISATGLCTVASTANLSDGDVVTISEVSGSIVETTPNPVTKVAQTLSLDGQSYFIQLNGATQFLLIRNYTQVNTRVPSTFTGTATATSGYAAKGSYVNASNVITVLAAAYNLFDPADRIQEDFNVQIPLHMGYAFAQAQANKATNVLGAFTDIKKIEYLGQNLQIMNHWQANTILGARTSNLFLGVDLLGDQSELSTVYLKPYTGDDVVRMKARMKAAVNYEFANELFYLSY